MNKNRYLAGVLGVFLSAALTVAAEDAPLRVKGAQGELVLDARGISLSPAIPGCPASQATGEPFWAIVLEPAPGSSGSQKNAVLESQKQARPEVKESPDGLTLTYGALADGQATFAIALSLTVRRSENAFVIGGEIRNDTKDWVVKGFNGPVFNGIRTDLAKTPLLLPAGFGWRINGVPSDAANRKPWTQTGNRLAVSATYPSAGGTMQWFAFAGESAGLYFGVHDPRRGAKTLSARYDLERKTFGAAIQHHFFVRPGERFALPPLVVLPYAGDWHVAARAYRAWVDSVEKQIDKPAWAKTSTGWLLAILKQQNGDIMWPYTRLDKLAEVADARGLDILGLFGWGYGGHDHLYPDYNPCPLMGGEKALREGIRQVHARGKRVILYANGQLLERGTAYWTTTGQHLAVTRKDGGTEQEFWHKYGNTPGYHFDIGCQASKGWRERMMSLAIQANDLGADGILYDQLGVRGPTPCYATDHGHPVPLMSYEADRKEMLRQIAEEMKKINPQFILMTEGFHDAVLDSVSYFHGCVRGAFQESAGLIARRLSDRCIDDLFPEMMRYTFPEVASTIRFPSPLVDRPMANYTVAYGLRYEIESRYIPDRDYLLDGRIPAIEDYGAVLSKPDITLIRDLPPKETAEYLKRVAVFQKKHAELLMTGTFTDSEGFSFRGQGVVAKGYQAGDAFGVLLWNTADKPAAFTLSVPKAKLASAAEPERGEVGAFSALPPQTVRLLVWKKP
jgi:hypothetical protein